MKNYPTWEAVLKSDEPMARLIVQAVIIISVSKEHEKLTPDEIYALLRKNAQEAVAESYRRRDSGK